MDQRLGRSNQSEKKEAGTVAGAYLALLANRGVDYLFGNAGTDFAPLIEAYSQAAQTGVPVPRPILATHENLAVSMAHGYGMVSRRIPAVMVHVSVGTANMICAAMNASRENVAILLTAGRSPLTEQGLPGSRDGYIHWAQEMYDQAGHDPRDRQMGLRAAKCRTAHDRRRSRPRDRGDRTARACLPLSAARGHRGSTIGRGAPIALPAQRGGPCAAPDANAVAAAVRMLARARRLRS